MNRSLIVSLFLQVTFIHLSGCSIARYSTGDLSKNPSLVHLDVNDVRNLIKIDETTGKFKSIKIKVESEYNKIFSVPYHRSIIYPAPNVCIPVEFPNGQENTAYLDTGFQYYAVLTSDIILKNKLAILPKEADSSGICLIPELNIGSVKIRDGIALYDEQQWQFRILNIPIYKHPNIILGLELIKSFDYILFDNIRKEAEFSKDKTFTPDNPDLWSSYPFEIKRGPYSNNRIMVQLSINGTDFEIFFDTCGDKPGLQFSQSDWDIIQTNFTVKNLRKSHYYNFILGRIPCQKATISNLSIGAQTIKNAEILINDEKDPIGKLSMFSLAYFQDTAVVLDFVNNLFWIKNKIASKSS